MCAPRRPRRVPPPTREEAERLIGTPVLLDKHVLCISKPAGMLSQPDLSGAAAAAEIGAAFLQGRAQVVHRLDKWATGLLLLARSPKAGTRLTAAFAQRLVTKSYLVAVQTRRSQRLSVGQTGVVEAAITANRRGMVQVSPLYDRPPANGRAEALRWHVLATERSQALLCASPHGGFKHQVRAMLGFAGMPLVGETRYGGCRAVEQTPPSFLALHAATLQLDHPVGDREQLRLRAPLPAEWRRVLPPSLISAAEHALSEEEIGRGILWDEPPSPPEFL